MIARPTSRLMVAVTSIAACLALVACGGTSTGAPSPSGTASIPDTVYTGGTARVTISASFGTVVWSGGSCDTPPTRDWLSVNAGAPNGDEYIGIVIGRSPYGPANAAVVDGGGTFSGSSVLVTWRHAGASSGLPRGSGTAAVAVDLTSGSFKGTIPGAGAVTGTFDCQAAGGPSPSAAPTAGSAAPTASPPARPTKKPARTPRPSASARPGASTRPSASTRASASPSPSAHPS